MTSAPNYGTVGNTTRHNSHAPDSTENEALLPRKPEVSSLRQRMNDDLMKQRADYILLVCYIITGLLDSAATVIWGSFVSMQTGNSIYLGLGLVDPGGSDRWIKSGTSIALFCMGSFFFSRWHRLAAGPKRRWVMIGSYSIQMLSVIIAAVIINQTPKPKPGDVHDLHWHVLVPIALIAFQSGGQTVASRALQFNSLTSTVLTSIYCDLFSDAQLFALPTQNAERNRRVGAPILLILGAMLGGLWAKSEFGLEGALWMAAIMKGGIVMAWAFWKSEPRDSQE